MTCTDHTISYTVIDYIIIFTLLQASFIDLDMKPLNKMEFYYELDQKIVDCYKQMAKVELVAAKKATIQGYETGY